jgi:hypothetical protein
MRHSWLLLTVALLLAACAGTPSKTVVNESIARSPEQPLPRKILLLPPEVRLHEVSAGGVVERVAGWTNAASTAAANTVRQWAAAKHAFEVVESPALSGEDKAALEQHIALYDLVAGSAHVARNSVIQAWRDRAKTFDYTLGPGLKPLAEHSGIDAALIVSGSDYISTAGRKAAMVMGTILGALAGVAVVPQGGISFISVGIVDLRTGDLLWFGTDQSGNADLRNEQDIKRMLEGLFQTYPGLAPVAKPKP